MSDSFILGSYSYQSPQQFDGSVVTQSVDIYALGGCLLHIMSGVPPWNNCTETTIKTNVKKSYLFVNPTSIWSSTDTKRALPIPIVVKTVIQQLLNIDPLKRPSIRQAIQLIQSDSCQHLIPFPYF